MAVSPVYHPLGSGLVPQKGIVGGGTIGVGQGLSLTSQVDEPGNLKQALCCGSDFSFQHPEAFFVAHMRVERAYDVYWL